MDDTETLPSYNQRFSVVSEPPVYGTDDGVSHSELPSTISSRPPTKEFTYEMKNFLDKPWATVTVQADGRLSRDTPVFLEGSTLEGNIKLKLRSSEAIISVCFFLRGVLLTSGDPPEVYMFFNLRHFVWTWDMGDPRAPQPANTEARWKNKLKGEYEWPFSFKFPEFTTHPKASAGAYRLPHTFTDPKSRGSIGYNLGVYIHREGKWRPDDTLTAPYGYFSTQQPGRPSPQRLLSFQNNTSLPGPFEDPTGWHALDPVSLRGRVFGDRDVECECSVFLAHPLRYTRTTAIPCAITFKCSDAQALDLFASIKTSGLYLQRRVNCTFHGNSTHVQTCGKAIWWPSTDAAAPLDSNKRHLMGEIPVTGDLAPSSAIPMFSVEYAVVLFAPDAVAFESQDSGPLVRQTVDVVTRFAPGARQVRRGESQP